MAGPKFKTDVRLPGDKPAATGVRKNLSKKGFADRKEARDSAAVKDEPPSPAPPIKPSVVVKPFLPPPGRPPTVSPFQTADPVDSRIKILLWGPTGTLKTRTALQFPSPVVVDLERSTDRYRSEFRFDLLPPSTATEILEAVRWLRDSRHSYKTLVLDTVTNYWSALQNKWSKIFLQRLGGRAGHKNEFYELGPREWATIKAEFAEFVATCLQCDLNLVFTAHDKARYESKGGGEFMQLAGEMPDAEKNLDRLFDVILRTEKILDPKGTKFFATTIKDRTARFAPRFELSYKAIADALGQKELTRDARPKEPPMPDQLAQIGMLVTELELTEAQIYDRLQTYGVSRFSDLSCVQAQTVLERLETARVRRQQKGG